LTRANCYRSGQQWRKGDAAEKNTVLKALWERIEIRLDEPTEDERMGNPQSRCSTSAKVRRCCSIVTACRFRVTVAPVQHWEAGMDGNRTHPGRLNSAPQTVLNTAL